jgi:Fe-S-cluster containining protein
MTSVPAAALAALQECYAQLAVALQPFQRHCAARGNCCNFAATGHRLYVTDLEAARMAAAGVEPERGQAERGLCPFLRGQLCGVREHRAIGCRIYFCDTTYEEERNALYETFLARVREIEATHSIPHRYRNVTAIDFSEFERVTS